MGQNPRGQSGEYGGAKPRAPKPKWWQHIFKQGYKAQLMEYQNDLNYWYWNQENKYNTPSAQKQRWMDAELNPALMYGQGTSGNASGVNAANSMDFNPETASSMLGAYNNLKMVNAQVDKVRADTDYTRAQTKTEGYRFDIAHIQKQMSTVMYKDMVEDFQSKQKTIRDLTDALSAGEMTQREGMRLSDYGKGMAAADIAAAEATMRTMMIDWLKANQLSKWIPVLGPILSVLFNQK